MISATAFSAESRSRQLWYPKTPMKTDSSKTSNLWRRGRPRRTAAAGPCGAAPRAPAQPPLSAPPSPSFVRDAEEKESQERCTGRTRVRNSIRRYWDHDPALLLRYCLCPRPVFIDGHNITAHQVRTTMDEGEICNLPQQPPVSLSSHPEGHTQTCPTMHLDCSGMQPHTTLHVFHSIFVSSPCTKEARTPERKNMLMPQVAHCVALRTLFGGADAAGKVTTVSAPGGGDGGTSGAAADSSSAVRLSLSSTSFARARLLWAVCKTFCGTRAEFEGAGTLQWEHCCRGFFWDPSNPDTQKAMRLAFCLG